MVGLGGRENGRGKGKRGKGEKGKRKKPHQLEELNANISSTRK